MMKITADGVYVHAGNYQKRDLFDGFVSLIKTYGTFDEETGVFSVNAEEITKEQLEDEIEQLVNQVIKPYRMPDDA